MLLFKELKNYKALGVVYNNIGCIHFKNDRIDEAIENWKETVKSLIYCFIIDSLLIRIQWDTLRRNLTKIESEKYFEPSIDFLIGLWT